MPSILSFVVGGYQAWLSGAFLLFAAVSLIVFLWTSRVPTPKPRDQCPLGGRHRVFLAQEDGGRGQIAYRSRCSKCNQVVGFGFDQIGRR